MIHSYWPYSVASEVFSGIFGCVLERIPEWCFLQLFDILLPKSGKVGRSFIRQAAYFLTSGIINIGRFIVDFDNF